jgi:hypothetical protein
MAKQTTTLHVSNPTKWHIGDMARISSAGNEANNGSWIVTSIRGFDLTIRPPTLLERLWYWLLRVTWKPRARWTCWRELRRAKAKH